MNFTNSISEAYVASSVLNNPEKYINHLKAEGITADYFHNHLPKMIWRMANSFKDEGRINEIESLEFSDQVKGQSNGSELSHDISLVRCEWQGGEILKQHLKILKNMYATRFAHIGLNEALHGLGEGFTAEEIAEASKNLTQGILSILENEAGWKSAKQGAEEFSDMLRTIHSDKSQAGVPSGILELDQITGGLSENELWVVGAQTSGGKTVLMFQIMAHFLGLGKNVLLFSLETEASRIHARLAANTLRIDMGKILATSHLPLIKNDIIKLRDYIEDVIASDCLTICDTDSISLESIATKSQQVQDSGKRIDLIVVDYIQLVSLMNSKDKPRHEQVAEVTRTLKQLAKKYKCPVITASQLNDDGKVRESRAIGHDADVLLNIGDDSENIFVAKNRNGERNKTLDLRLNGAMQRFE